MKQCYLSVNLTWINIEVLVSPIGAVGLSSLDEDEGRVYPRACVVGRNKVLILVRADLFFLQLSFTDNLDAVAQPNKSVEEGVNIVSNDDVIKLLGRFVSLLLAL